LQLFEEFIVHILQTRNLRYMEFKFEPKFRTRRKGEGEIRDIEGELQTCVPNSITLLPILSQSSMCHLSYQSPDLDSDLAVQAGAS
jgi:hypothetical protein